MKEVSLPPKKKGGSKTIHDIINFVFTLLILVKNAFLQMFAFVSNVQNKVVLPESGRPACHVCPPIDNRNSMTQRLNVVSVLSRESLD